MPAQRTCRCLGAAIGVVALCLFAASASSAPQYEVRRIGYHPSGWDPDQNDHVIDWRNGWMEGYTELNGSIQLLWMYDVSADTTTPIGLNDEAHADSEPDLMTDTGFAAGTANRIDPGDGTPRGVGVWVYNPITHTNTEAGLYSDPEFVNQFGERMSTIDMLTSAGNAAGTSFQYHDADGSYHSEKAAWVFDVASGATIRVALSGPSIDPDTAQTTIQALSNAGQAAGYTTDQSGNRRAWIFDIATQTITPIGFGDSAAEPFGNVLEMSDSGYVLGSSTSPWLYDPTLAATVPLAGPPGSGFENHNAVHVNESGLVVGESHNADATDGEAWIFDPGTGQYRIVETGLNLGSNTAYVRPTLFDDAGNVAGSAAIYSPSGTKIRDAAWYCQYASNTGRELTAPSEAMYINPAAIVAPTSVLSYGVWEDLTTSYVLLDDPNSGSTILGPHDDGVHPGTTYGAPILDGARVAGQAMRGSDYALGATGWTYNTDTGAAHSFDLSVRSDGYAYSNALIYTDRGVVIGGYHKFGSNDEDLGPHPFRWTPNTGAVDLESLITGPTLADFGVDELYGEGDTRLFGTIPSNYIAFGAHSTLSNHPILIAFVEVPNPPCAGDVDGDFDTDVFDFAILALHFARAVPPNTDGDLDGDGVVTAFDFATLAESFGCTP